MFGLRLKTWMEAHLVRPRHKSTAHQNQKQQRGTPKDSSSSSSSTVTNSSVILGGGGGASIGSSSNTTTSSSNSKDIFQSHNHHPAERNSNSSSSSDQQQHHHHHSGSDPLSLKSSTVATTNSSSLSSSDVLETQHHQGDEEEDHLNHEQQRHQQQQQQHGRPTHPTTSGNGSGHSSSNSTNILLGSFSNNLSLSSPDTGYSTDGYSPKSVYPALSFESSGKSTPKSSYTISSLVSSERLHHLNNTSSSSGASSKSTGGLPSKNSSISNGLELEEEECCDIPHGRQGGGQGGDQTSIQSSTAHSSLNLPEAEEEEEEEENDEESQHHPRRLNENNGGHHHHLDEVTSTCSSSMDELKDERRGSLNETIGLTPNNSGSSNPSNKQQTTTNCNVNTINSKAGGSINSGSGGAGAGAGSRPPLPSIESTAVTSAAGAMTRKESEHMLLTSNSNAISSAAARFPVCSEKHDYFHHRRTESMDEQRARHEGIESGSSPSSSSKLTAGVCVGGRNIRTSLLLTSSSQIPPECNPGLKNAFSLCSPRRQRTRIKTNPWISLTQHNDHNNFHLTYLHNNNNRPTTTVTEGDDVNSPTGVINPLLSSMNMTAAGVRTTTTQKQIYCPSTATTGVTNSCQNHYPNSNNSSTTGVGGGVGTKLMEINKVETEGVVVKDQKKQQQLLLLDDQQEEQQHCGGMEGTDVVNSASSSSSLLYRISTSTSASDSGKGSMEPGTNRNSTESSCLLSEDSSRSSNSGNSARNSIISPENTISSGGSGGGGGNSIIIIPKNINTVPVQTRLVNSQQQQQQCVSSQASKTTIAKSSSLSTSSSSASSSSKLKSNFKETASITTTTTATTITTPPPPPLPLLLPPSICITNSSKPSGKRLHSLSASKRGNNKLSGVSPCGPPASSSTSIPSCQTETTRCSTKLDNYHHSGASMVDKETDILSDWANTDEDGDEEDDDEYIDNEEDEELEEGDENEECITPTPSSPDFTFNNSSSCSSKLEFIDVADRVRHPKTNINLHANHGDGGFLMGGSAAAAAASHVEQQHHGRPMLIPSYQQQHNMNLPTNTACYQSVPMSPNTQIVTTKLNSSSSQSPMMRQIPIQCIPDAYAYDNVHHLNQISSQDSLSPHQHHHGFPPMMTTTPPAVTATRCFNNNNNNNKSGGGGITNSKLKQPGSHNNNNTSQTIARGAIGFLRKMFKKGTSSSHGGGYGGKGGKFLRSHGANNKDCGHSSSGMDRDSDTIIPVGLLSPESVVVTNYPLANTKPLSPAINGNFLTPTPNSFRRRSTGPNGNSDTAMNESSSKGSSATTSKHKAIKTDIIRLPHPPPPASSSQLATSSSSLQSQSSQSSAAPIHSKHHHHHHHPSQTMLTSNANNGAPPLPYTSSPKVSGGCYQQSNASNTNTNSTTGSSSVHSMSITSQCSSNSRFEQQQQQQQPHHHKNQVMMSPAAISSRNSQHHEPSPSLSNNYSMNDVLHNPSRQSPFMSTPNNNNSHHHHHNRTSRVLQQQQHHINNDHTVNVNDGSPVPLHERLCQNNPGCSSSAAAAVSGQLGVSRTAADQHNHHDNLIPSTFSPNLNNSSSKACPYDSPRLQHQSMVSGGSRINSPSFNNYSPIHRLVVTGGNHHHLLNRALPLPSGGCSSSSTSSFHPPITTTTSTNVANNNNNSHHQHSPLLLHHPLTPNSHGHNLNRPVTTTSSPLINHRHHSAVSSSSSSGATQHQQQLLHPFVTCSPSPVLRNPRYQYITSSNQNSPLLNIPKRLNVPLNVPKGGGGSPGISRLHNIPLFQPPPPSTIVNYTSSNATGTFLTHGNGSGGQQSNYYCQNLVRAQDSSPQSNSRHPHHHHQQQHQISQNQRLTTNYTPPPQNHTDNNHDFIGGGVVGGGGHVLHKTNEIFPHHHPPPPPPPDIFRQSQSSHYYSSPVAGGVRTSSPFYPHHRAAPPELNGLSHCGGGRGQAERIYETVDDSEEDEVDDLRSDDGDGEGGDFEFPIQLPGHHHQPSCLGPPEYRIRRESDIHFRRSIDSDTSVVIGGGSSSSHHSHNSNNNLQQNSVSSSGSGGGNSNSSNSRCKSKSTSKSKSRRSKREPAFSSSSSSQHQHHQQIQAPQQPPLPPRSFPMSLGTYLSETETRLLEADKDTDRKYKRLIHEAEALLKEISVEKSHQQQQQQPSAWLSRYARESLRHDDCPQSDPLRRKAYDCWALRRLQHQLAGLASPPVLHRKSPMSPSGNQNLFVFRNHHEFPFTGGGDRRNSLSSNNNAPLL